MITKWICIPYGIVIVVIAGFVKSVIPDYLSSYSMWYSSYEAYSILEYALMFGVYGGILTGLFVDTFSHRVSLLLAAVMSLVSYWFIPQFDGSSRTKLEDWHFYVLTSLVFIGGQSVSLALVSTVKVCLLNFPITASPMVLSILLSYWYICMHIESSLRWSFFFGVDTKVYTMGVGIATSVIYAIGAVVMKIEKGSREQSGVSQYHLAMLDKVGLTMFVICEIFMILLLLLFKLIIKDVVVSTWIWVALLIGNFILPIINAECVLNRASDLLRGFSPEIDELHRLQRGRDKNLFASLKSLKLLLLLIAMIILVGCGAVIYERLSKISIAISMGYLAEYAMIWFIFGNFVTRWLLGLLYAIINVSNDFTYMVFFAAEIVLSAFVIIFIPNRSVLLFNSAWFIAGSGVGGLSISVPLVIAQDFGKKHFGVIWGTFTLGMEIGVWIFSMVIFDHFYDKYNKDRWGRCTKKEWFSTAFILTTVWAIIGLIMVGIVWYMDTEDIEEGSKERNRVEEGKMAEDPEMRTHHKNIALK